MSCGVVVQGATHMLVLRVEARLLVRIALKMGLPVRSEADYSIYHRTTIATVRIPTTTNQHSH